MAAVLELHGDTLERVHRRLDGQLDEEETGTAAGFGMALAALALLGLWAWS